MIDRQRTLFLILAIALLFIVVLIEIGSRLFLGNALESDLPTPGLGVPYLALVDGIVLFILVMYGLAKIIPPGIFGMIQGLVSLLFMLLLLIASIILIYIAILLVTLMITLLLAVPFGTLFYLGAFGHFEVGGARITLGLLMLLKLATVVCLFLAQQSFLTGKGLLLLLLTSLLANVVVSFLHGLVPIVLVSILDAVAAIIVAVLAAIWALIKLIGSIFGVVMGLRLDRHFT